MALPHETLGVLIPVSHINAWIDAINSFAAASISPDGTTWTGLVRRTINTKAGNYTILSTDDVVFFTATATATLPASPTNGQAFLIKAESGVTVTVTPNSGTIDGAATFTLNGYGYVLVVYNGSEWSTFGQTTTSLFSAGNSGTAITINFKTNGPLQTVTRNGNCTFTLTAPPQPTTVVLELVHDATANSYTVAFSPAVKFPGGTVPTWTQTNGAVDILTLFWDGSNWYGTGQVNFS